MCRKENASLKINTFNYKRKETLHPPIPQRRNNTALWPLLPPHPPSPFFLSLFLFSLYLISYFCHYFSTALINSLPLFFSYSFWCYFSLRFPFSKRFFCDLHLLPVSLYHGLCVCFSSFACLSLSLYCSILSLLPCLFS